MYKKITNYTICSVFEWQKESQITRKKLTELSNEEMSLSKLYVNDGTKIRTIPSPSQTMREQPSTVQSIDSADVLTTVNDKKEDNEEVMKEEHIAEILDFRRHWDADWRAGNTEAAKRVEEALNNNEHKLIVVAYNSSEWKNVKDEYYFSNFSFIKLVNDDNIIKEEFDEYWLFEIRDKLIILDNICIDGSIYIVNCELQCKKNVDIKSNIFITKNGIFSEEEKKDIKIIEWNTKIYYEILIKLQDIEENLNKYFLEKKWDDCFINSEKYLKICIETFGLNNYYVATAYNNIGILFKAKEQPDKAIEFIEKAINIMNNYEKDNMFIAQLYHNLGESYNSLEQHDIAINLFEKAIKIKLNLFNEDHSSIIRTYNSLAFSYYQKDKNITALQLYEKVLNIRLNKFGNDHIDIASSYKCLGRCYDSIEDFYTAINYYKKSLNIIKICNNNQSDIAVMYYDIARIYYHVKQYDDAIDYHQKALEIRLNNSNNDNNNSIDIINSYDELGLSYFNIENYDESIKCWESSLKIKLNIFGKYHSDVAFVYMRLGSSYFVKGFYSNAIECCENALQIRKTIFQKINKDLSDTYLALGAIFEKIGKKEIAIQYFEELWKARSQLFGEWNQDTDYAKKRLTQIENEDYLIICD
ncbi:hypothetical protein RFI_25455 [Reticulomyxa filosa]|uniref:Uncharacterized protein n=1 Tax=Reticulomyxa filosa TaxID=46433 RepID=X6MEU8_RETFI|nr:hypothetical protein RFI_25455 [Reticulomyxa filosa]|eukprot:ETO11922.1 hypothetical protein RFI_25455 [Reticulomyxa filosa]